MKLTQVTKNKVLIFILSFIFFFKLLIVLNFKNSDWEPDSFMHFLELRTIFADFPNNLSLGLGVWTKPLYAYPLGFLVQIFNIKDLVFIDVVNIFISLFISLIVYKIVYKIIGSYRIAIFSIFLTSFSLTLFKSSTSALTDQIFGLMLILCAYFALNKKYKLASLFVGLSVLGRIEGLFFVTIYNLWLIVEIGMLHNLKAKVKNILILWIITIIPVFIWNFLGFLDTGFPLFIFQAGYSAPAGTYGYGGLLSFPKRFFLEEFVVSLAFLLGTFFLFKRLKQLNTSLFLLFLWISFSGFFLVEVILWKLGIFGSAGLMRYFVGVVPFMVIIGCYGIYRIFLKINNSKQFLILSLLVILHLGLLVLHLSGIGFKQQFPESNNDFKIAGEWIKNNIPEEEFLYADRPETIYYANRSLTNSANRFGEEFSGRKSGVYVWSREWGKAVFNINLADIQNENILFKIEESIYIFKI